LSFLLDTHVWVWSLSDPRRIQDSVMRVLRKHGAELCLSPISIWELQTLVEKKRIAFNQTLSEWFEGARIRLPVHELPLTNDIAYELMNFPLPHRDPADRFLVATARVYDLTLVTADERLINAKVCKVLANR
jgi:PIN domain nuclease of toxin-antitoxin system